MSKDFEEEYKVYMYSEVPDLWSRIEAGLDAQEKDETNIAVDEQKDKVVQFTEDSMAKPKSKKKGISYRTVSLVFAACICGIIVVPFMISGIVGRGMYNMSAGVGSASDEMTNQKNDETEETVLEAACEVENVEEPMNSVAISANEGLEESLMDSTEISIETTSAEMADCMICADHITVRIASEEVAEEGMRYTAIIISGDSSGLVLNPDNQTVNIRLFNETDTVTVEGEYVVNLYNASPELSSVPIYEMEMVD